MTIVTPTGIVGINSITSLVNDITFSTASGGSLTANGLSFTSINGGPLSGFRNRIINGDMQIDQRNNGSEVTLSATSLFTVDRFLAIEVTDGTATVQQSTDAPSGFNNSIVYTVSTTDTSLSSTQYSNSATHVIEGLHSADFQWGTSAAQSVTMSFWVKGSVTGTYSLAIRNKDLNRSYVATYSISVANTWEKKTITIPGDTTGTWLTNSDRGIVISFSIAVGSTYQATPGSWNAGNFFGTSTSVNMMSTAGATWRLTGVQLELGTVATPFERRSYGQELALCQRYAVRFGGEGTYSVIGFGRVSSTTSCFTLINLPVEMRVKPTLTSSGSYEVNGISVTGFSVDTNASTRKGSIVNASVASGLTAGQAGALLAMADTNASFLLNAEL